MNTDLQSRIDRLAEHLWKAEAIHVSGKPRNVDWNDAPELELARFKNLAISAINFLHGQMLYK